MKAVKRFDPERGVRLVSFAMHWIRAEIHEYILRNWRLVKIATTKAQRKLFFNLRSMKSGLNTLTPAEVEAMATQLRVKPEEVIEMETRLGGGDVSLEPSDDDEDSYSPIAYLANPDDEPGRSSRARPDRPDPDGRPRRRPRQSGRRAAAGSSRRAGSARIGGSTLHELAGEFGVSAERIRQIEVQAMKKLKGAMAEAA
jgi:RNA polymerase sigma-32 factor